MGDCEQKASLQHDNDRCAVSVAKNVTIAVVRVIFSLPIFRLKKLYDVASKYVHAYQDC